MNKIAAATNNKGKITEIREILKEERVELVSMGELFNPVPEIDETGSTFLENALIKARWVFDHCGLWTLADDSGLEVDFLGGEPGVRSARYAGESCDYKANNEKLLKVMEGVPEGRRGAAFRCVIVLATGKDQYIKAEGVCRGKIGFAPEGAGGFGYDPLFIPDGYSSTFAQLSPDVKNSISHRGRALSALKEKLHEFLR